MATRITIKGQVTIPKTVRDALCLCAGDRVDFTPNSSGEFVVRKAQPLPPPPSAAQPPQARVLPPRPQEQVRLRAEELLELLRGLD
ncbi:MAG TPA: AbrB/MazE/SpoVT family DNA-binding domain-containing protein [Steroidobacteraceae bacterium]|nr:AbrB/MazE/SpoVT family DNA-binding domain-containing protein [Steroidobacteraceae bacterium]